MPRTNPLSCKLLRPRAAQNAMFAIILALALATTCVGGYLLSHLIVLRDMYEAEYKQDCADCTPPSWFKGTRQSWGARYDTLVVQWIPVVTATTTGAAATAAYILAHLATAKFNTWFTATCTDILMCFLLAAWAITIAGVSTTIGWPFGYETNTTQNTEERGSPSQFHSLMSGDVCGDVGRICSPTQATALLPWIVGALLLLFCAGEAWYVLARHGSRGLRFNLRYLEWVSASQRDPGVYIPMADGVDMRASSPENPRVSVPPVSQHYPGQGDAPPTYTYGKPFNVGTGGVGTSPTDCGSPSGWAEHKAALTARGPDDTTRPHESDTRM